MIKKLGLVFTLLPSIFLIFGCILIFVGENIISFIFSLTLPILVVLNLIFGIYWLIKKNKVFLFSFFSVIIYLFYFDSFVQFHINNDDILKDSISIITYNTQSFGLIKNVSNNDKDEKIINFINKQDADVVVIQEFSYFTLKYFKKYPFYFLGYRKNVEKSTQVILSKFPIINKGYVDFANTRNNAMFIDVSYNNEKIRIYNLHLESFRTTTIHQLNNPNSYPPLIKRIREAEKTRKAQSELVKNHIDEFNGKVIICGDFNSTQFSSTYKTLKKDRDDTFIEAGFGLGATYKLFNYPFRLDYVLVDDNFEVLSHENFKLKLSDHEPIRVSLILN
jgi:endonuclease/exonuclease/phosphatase (EEP) superfamily protein YafD